MRARGNAKAPRRLKAILRGYRRLIESHGLGAVSYVTDRPDVAALVRREARLSMLGSAIEVGPLEHVVAMTRKDAGEP